jgi:SAM-dependent methyltransferase
LTGALLDVGCGWSPYRSVLLAPGTRITRYIGLDLESGLYKSQPDLTWDGRTIPLLDASIDSAIATEVLEHCPDPGRILGEISRVLRPGGLLFLTVPFLWPLHDSPYDEYRYTPFSLDRLLVSTGFADVRISAMGGWDAALATMIGLWVRRRPDLPPLLRRILQRAILPVYAWLLKSDRPPSDFSRSCMITGLSATARKPVSPA